MANGGKDDSRYNSGKGGKEHFAKDREYYEKQFPKIQFVLPLPGGTPDAGLYQPLPVSLAPDQWELLEGKESQSKYGFVHKQNKARVREAVNLEDINVKEAKVLLVEEIRRILSFNAQIAPGFPWPGQPPEQLSREVLNLAWKLPPSLLQFHRIADEDWIVNEETGEKKLKAALSRPGDSTKIVHEKEPIRRFDYTIKVAFSSFDTLHPALAARCIELKDAIAKKGSASIPGFHTSGVADNSGPTMAELIQDHKE